MMVTIAYFLRAFYGYFNDCGICSVHATICRTHNVTRASKIDYCKALSRKFLLSSHKIDKRI